MVGAVAMSDELEQLRAAVQQLQDIEAIKQLKARYCQLVDTKEWDRWAAEILTEDYRLEGDGGVHDGRDGVVAFVSSNLAEARTVHHCHTPVITITGPDTATGVWAMQDHVHMTLDGTALAFRGAGHYHEQYVRTPDGWRIRSTVATRLAVDPLPVLPDVGDS